MHFDAIQWEGKGQSDSSAISPRHLSRSSLPSADGLMLFALILGGR